MKSVGRYSLLPNCSKYTISLYDLHTLPSIILTHFLENSSYHCQNGLCIHQWYMRCVSRRVESFTNHCQWTFRYPKLPLPAQPKQNCSSLKERCLWKSVSLRWSVRLVGVAEHSDRPQPSKSATCVWRWEVHVIVLSLVIPSLFQPQKLIASKH